MFRVVLQNTYTKDFCKFDEKDDKKRHRGGRDVIKKVFLRVTYFLMAPDTNEKKDFCRQKRLGPGTQNIKKRKDQREKTPCSKVFSSYRLIWTYGQHCYK